jgi:hypothetical protein
MQFPTAESYRTPRNEPELRPSERAPRRKGLRPTTQEVHRGGIELPVRVNHGRWVVDCPVCLSAQLASSTEQRFLCAECGNISNAGGKWLPLVWPPDAVAIEAALAIRPTENRNWLPGESVSDLRRENNEHGIGGLV